MTDLDPRVFRPATFICGTGTGCNVGYIQRPDKVICASLLEEVSDWKNAFRDARDVPQGMRDALDRLYEATLGWSDWLDRSAAQPATQNGASA